MISTRNRCVMAPHGRYCIRAVRHPGPCAARPRWWNVRAHYILWKAGR